MHRIINKLPIRIENLEPWGKINAVNNYLFLIKIVNKKVKLTLITWSQSNFTTKHTHSILCFNLWHKNWTLWSRQNLSAKIGLNIGCVGDLHLILFYFKHICNCMLTTLLGNRDKITKLKLSEWNTFWKSIKIGWLCQCEKHKILIICCQFVEFSCLLR